MALPSEASLLFAHVEGVADRHAQLQQQPSDITRGAWSTRPAGFWECSSSGAGRFPGVPELCAALVPGQHRTCADLRQLGYSQAIAVVSRYCGTSHDGLAEPVFHTHASGFACAENDFRRYPSVFNRHMMPKLDL